MGPTYSTTNTAEQVRHFSRRSLLKSGAGLGAAAAFSPLLAACGDSSSAGSGGRSAVNYQLYWITNVEFAGTYIGLSKGYFKDAGVDLTLKGGGPNISVIPLVQSGAADIGLANPPQVVAANAAGADMVMVGAMYQKSPDCITSLASNPLKTPEDVVGKRIGLAPDAIPQTKAWMKANGLDYESIKVVPTNFDITPLIKGEVDGYFGWTISDPITLELQGIESTYILYADTGLPDYNGCYAVRRDTLKDKSKREAIKSFLEAERRGWEEAIKDPQGATDITMNKYGSALKLDGEQQLLQMKASIPLMATSTTDANGLFWMSEEDMEPVITALNEMGSAATGDMFDNSLLEELGS